MVEAMAKSLMREWPEHSGSRVYPVPSFDGNTPSEEFHWASEDKRLWSKAAPYGRARWALLEYLIERVAEAVTKDSEVIWL